jgi:hypothetical protein
MRFRTHPVPASLLHRVPTDAEIIAESQRVQARCDPDYAPVPVHVFRGPGDLVRGFAIKGEEVTYCLPSNCARSIAATTIAHEVAHLIIPEWDHCLEWHATFCRVLREAYGLELADVPLGDPHHATRVAGSLLAAAGF